MRVFIAEKPSLAQAIFEGLGGNPKTEMKQGYYQHGNDRVTWCYGHMLELFDPQDYDPKYEKWHFPHLPIKTVYPPTLKPKPESKKQLNIIIELLKQSSSIVNAGDPDEEGCLLVDEILDHVGNTKPVMRLLVADLNIKPVQHALASMKPNEDFRPMTNSALARSMGDQSFGYNLTRAFTLKGREKGFDGVLNVGRVQSAVLGLVNSRTLANQNHQESYYYDISGQFDAFLGIVTAKYQPSDKDIIDEKNRLIDAGNAEMVKENVIEQDATIIDVTTKTDNKAAPLPYNLSSLQQTCAKRFGYSANDTLETMQSLYETHKLLTYPRTDCRYLGDAHLASHQIVFSAISATLPECSASITFCDHNRKHKAFNASKITAHHAITPTEKSGENINLTEKERNIYTLVAHSFIALFYPDSVRDKTRVLIEGQQKREFVATQSILKEQGWEILFRGDIDVDKPIEGIDLSILQPQTTTQCQSINIDKKKTQPLKYFVESTLLAAMTKAAKYCNSPELRQALEAKDKDNSAESGSIGTEATRAGILAKLAKNATLISVVSEKGYKEKVWKTTQSGQEFCAILPQEIIAPDTSAIWAQQQAHIRNGKMDVQSFVDGIDRYLDERIRDIADSGVNITSTAPSCPTCNKGFLRRRKGTNGHFWACNRYPECKTTFPDKKGKLNIEKKEQKNKGETSSTEFCKECGSPLTRRPAKRKDTFWWGCSGFPKCKVRFFDRNGKPDRDKGAIG